MLSISGIYIWSYGTYREVSNKYNSYSNQTKHCYSKLNDVHVYI